MVAEQGDFVPHALHALFVVTGEKQPIGGGTDLEGNSGRRTKTNRHTAYEQTRPN